MLKQEGLLATLKGIEELDLIVSIAALVVPTINKADLVSNCTIENQQSNAYEDCRQFATNSGFGGIHNAVLAMSSRILGSTKWANAIQPSDESEQNDAGTRAHGKTSISRCSRICSHKPYRRRCHGVKIRCQGV